MLRIRHRQVVTASYLPTCTTKPTGLTTKSHCHCGYTSIHVQQHLVLFACRQQHKPAINQVALSQLVVIIRHLLVVHTHATTLDNTSHLSHAPLEACI